MHNTTWARIIIIAVALVCVSIMLKKRGYVSRSNVLSMFNENQSSAVIEVDEDNFKAEVIDSSLPVMVDFAASWCGPCKKLAPVVSKLATKYEGRVKICHVDIDHARKITKAYAVESVPTLMFFLNGKITHSTVGLQSEKHIEAALDKLINIAATELKIGS